MPAPVPRERATPDQQQLAAKINHTHQYGLRIVLEAHQHLAAYPHPVSNLCAVLEQESNITNVYGHDAVKWPQIKGGNVTRLSYARYKLMRNLGLGNQGVGPGQLTSPGYQDEADNSGGCWSPGPNIATTAWVLSNVRRAAGSWAKAFEMYNAGKVGTAVGAAYSAKVQAKQREWLGRLT